MKALSVDTEKYYIEKVYSDTAMSAFKEDPYLGMAVVLSKNEKLVCRADIQQEVLYTQNPLLLEKKVI